MTSYLTKCSKCGLTTSKAYARRNGGQCKACMTGTPRNNVPTRQERVLEHGYQAYAREEGHYDMPDWA